MKTKTVIAITVLPAICFIISTDIINDYKLYFEHCSSNPSNNQTTWFRFSKKKYLGDFKSLADWQRRVQSSDTQIEIAMYVNVNMKHKQYYSSVAYIGEGGGA